MDVCGYKLLNSTIATSHRQSSREKTSGPYRTGAFDFQRLALDLAPGARVLHLSP